MKDLLIQICAGLITTLIIFLTEKISNLIRKNYKNVLITLIPISIFYAQIIIMVYTLDKIKVFEINIKNIIYLFSLSLSLFSIVQMASFLNSLLSIGIFKYSSKNHKK